MRINRLRRREFITLLGGAVAWPLATRAQQQALPVIGYLSARSPEDTEHLVPVFRRGLAENGYVEGQTVTIEYRWALGHPDRLPAMAAELVRKPVDVLASTGGESAALAAKAAPKADVNSLPWLPPLSANTGPEQTQQKCIATPPPRRRSRAGWWECRGQVPWLSSC
jgi:hypothetical protein